MNISRGEVSKFQYASTKVASASGADAILTIGTTEADGFHKFQVTDIKMSCGVAAATVKFFIPGGLGQALEFDLASSSNADYSWQMPYEFTATSGTGATKKLVGSASVAGVKYAVSGYIDK